ncbi:hypothetical protein PGJ_00006850 [Porphyromonas gingivalis AJW4]|nr:hypothetical protein PGJ_00006850 [Porphyromonas gingivalis AJW4]SJL20915.1 hypothetical protein PGIN_3A1_00333 [Porphyromonas gingivalis]
MVYCEKKEFLPNYFRRVSVGAAFCFPCIPFYDKMQSPETAFFVFTALLCLYILHLCPCIMSGTVVRCQ